MEVRAVTRYVRISPRKARLVTELIKGKPVEEALTTLKFVPKKGARLVSKTLQSALANAEQNPNSRILRVPISAKALQHVRPSACRTDMCVHVRLKSSVSRRNHRITIDENALADAH